MAIQYKTIHIHGFGIVQVINKKINIQTEIANVQAEADACIDNVWSKNTSKEKQTKEYHQINIFKNSFADWHSKIKGESFRVKISELEAQLFEALATAVVNAQTTPIENIS